MFAVPIEPYKHRNLSTLNICNGLSVFSLAGFLAQTSQTNIHMISTFLYFVALYTFPPFAYHSHMKEKILSQWQQLQSWRTSTCLSRYLDKVRCIPLFGHHQFECLQKIPSEGSMPVTLAVGEDGVRILNKSHSVSILAY